MSETNGDELPKKVEAVESTGVVETTQEDDSNSKKRKAEEDDKDKEDQKDKVSKLSDDVQAATSMGEIPTSTTDDSTTTALSSNIVVPTTDEAVAAALAKANTSSIAPSEQAKAEVVGTVATTLCLTTSLMPQVIGANGEILMAIKAASSADVTCKLDGAPSPSEFLILITGSFNEVHAAFGLVITYAKNPAVPVYNAKLIITRDDASGLIGKKGSVVHAIRTSLGGGEQYFKINTTQGPTPTVELNGSLEICMQAHYLVHHHLQNQYSRVALRGGSTDPGTPGPAGGGDSDNLKLQVDTSKLGNILGRNGARIKAIRAESGARVFIESKDIEPHRSLRWVTVTGTTEQKEFANYLIILAVNEGQIPGVDAAGAQVAATAWASLENTTLQVAAGVVLPALLNQSNGGGGGGSTMGGGSYRARESGRYKVAICRNYANGNCRFGASCDFAHGEHELQAGNMQQSSAYGGGGGYGAQPMGYGGAGGYDPANTLVVQVAAHQLGALFGKGGERIQEMRNHCGCKLVVEDKNIDPGRTMRNVMISGNEAQRQWGNYLVSLAVQTGEMDVGGTFRQGLLASQAACQQAQPQYQQPQQQQQYQQQQQHYGGGGGHYGY